MSVHRGGAPPGNHRLPRPTQFRHSPASAWFLSYVTSSYVHGCHNPPIDPSHHGDAYHHTSEKISHGPSLGEAQHPVRRQHPNILNATAEVPPGVQMSAALPIPVNHAFVAALVTDPGNPTLNRPPYVCTLVGQCNFSHQYHRHASGKKGQAQQSQCYVDHVDGTSSRGAPVGNCYPPSITPAMITAGQGVTNHRVPGCLPKLC